MLSVDYEHCTGCMACVQKCPRQCISMVEGEFGFLYPQVNREQCVDCHFCEQICPVNKDVERPTVQKAFAVVHKNPDVVNDSTSGGAFTAFAKLMLQKSGVIYGCSMDNFQVHHIRVDKEEKLIRLRGSKYVQSNTEDTYRQAESDLRNGKTVLYSGTPCQIAGLKKFLGKPYENLFTIDIICHGVGSQKYFDKFLDDLARRLGKVLEIKFRSKRYVGWSCGGMVVSLSEKGNKNVQPFYNHENYYYSYFLSGDIYRKSCYSCPYASMERQGDITLGDFWGVESLKLTINSYRGCSLVLANSEKGERVLKQLSDIECVEVKLKDAMKHNSQLVHPSELKDQRNLRILEYETMSGEQIQHVYIKNNKKVLLKGKIKTMIPYSLKVKLRGGYKPGVPVVYTEVSIQLFSIIEYRRDKKWLLSIVA